MHETKKKNAFKRETTVTLIVLMVLPVLNWLVFWLYVNISSLALAFQHPRTGDFDLVNFRLLYNSITMVGGEIGIALRNTGLFFAVHLLITLPLSLFIAFFLYKRVYGYGLYRIVFYLPAVIPSLVMVTAFKNFIDPDGPLGAIMKWLGNQLPPEGLLARTSSAVWVIVVYTIWTGFTTDVLLFTGGMARIPTEIIEAAKLDGCGPAREVVSIVLPLIWPTISTQIVLLFTNIFSAGGPVLFLTNGKYETSTIAFWIFTQVYGNGQLGGTGSYNLVSCAGMSFTLISVPLILGIRKLMSKVDTVEY